MLVAYAVAIAGAVLFFVWGVTARPPVARANLFADLPRPEAPPPKLAGVMRSLGRVVPSPLTKGLNDRLVQAGHPRGFDLPRLLGLKVVLALMLGALFVVIGQP